MSNHTIRLSLAILALAVAPVVALTAGADQAAAPTKESAPATPAKDVARPAAPAGGWVVFVDPATGKVRQPDPAEIGALVGGQKPATATAGPAIGAGGGVGVKLGPESYSYVVVTKGADGKILTDCVVGNDAANTLVSTGVPPKAKEARDAK